MKRTAIALVGAIAIAFATGAHAMPKDPLRFDRESPADALHSDLPIQAVTLAKDELLPGKGGEVPIGRPDGGTKPQDPKGGNCTVGIDSEKLGSNGCPGNVPEPGSTALLALATLALLATRLTPLAKLRA